MAAQKVRYDMGWHLVCEEHYEHTPISCCPFPGCRNGTDADEIEVADGYLTEKIFRRFEWQKPNGAKCYSWQNPNRPVLVMLKRVMSREAALDGLSDRNDPRRRIVIYHYTTPEALLGIVEKNELWMSDYSFMNDAEELTYGLAVAKDRFEKAAEELPHAGDILRRWGNPSDLGDIRACVGSFSLISDSLSQWRAYGSISIGFLVGPLMFGYNNSVRLNRVVYDLPTQQRHIDLMAHLTATAYEHDKKILEPDHLKTVYDRGGENLLEVTAFFKHPTFADEREARMVHIEDRKVYEHLRVESPPNRFRVSGGIILPYVTTKDLITLKDKPVEKIPIVEIVIGPTRHVEVLERGIDRLLKVHGHDDVEITRSTAPLRV